MRVAYISGRYRARTIFGVLWNVWKARRVAIRYWRMGYAVICPHMNTAFFSCFKPDLQNCIGFIKGDIALIRRLRPKTDSIVMIRGWEQSEGAVQELAAAKRRGVTIIYDER